MVWGMGELKGGIENALVTIHLLEEGCPAPNPIGSGFIVGLIGGNAIGLTATHIFEEIRKNLVGTDRAAIPDIFRRARNIDPSVLRDNTVAVFAGDNGQLHSRPITAYSGYNGADVATFFVSLNDMSADVLPSLQIDTTPPKKGTEIAVTSFGNMKRSPPFRVSSKSTGQLFQRRSEIRVGKILDVHIEGCGLLRGPCIRTNIPTTPGMSGGAVLYWDPKQEAIPTVLGIVSADASSELAHKNGAVDGDSTAALICSVLPICFEIQSAEETISKSVNDLISEGKIVDVGRDHGNWTIRNEGKPNFSMQWRQKPTR